MRVQFNGSRKQEKPLRRSAVWLCVLTGFCVLALMVRIAERLAFAQDSPLPSTSTGQLGISPEEPVAPPQPIVVKVPASSATVPSQADKPKIEMPPIPAPDPNNPVAVQTANLLKLVYNLKTEVDKTTKDTLSVTVVRQATEIEQMARKMRAK